MNLFKKEKNEINNRKLKVNLCNAAIAFLKEGDEYDNLINIKAEFGYLFDIKNHGLEALFKVTTDRGVYYFAAQGSKLIKLDFNEELFRSTVDTFLKIHKQ